VAEYRYHFYDLRSQAYIDTLPVEGASFSTELRGVGSFSGECPLFADGLTADRVMDATIPHRTKIFVERDNALVWGGRIVPARDYDSSTGRLRISAEETLGAFSSRFLPNLTYAGVDQLVIARSLLQTLQADGGGNMGITFGSETSGVMRDRNYNAGDRTAGLSAFTDLSEVINGFEFATQVGWGSLGLPEEKLLLGYPRIGRAQSASGLVLEYDRFTASGGNVSAYSWSDGPGLFTRSWATTETEENVQVAASAVNTDLITAGYPLLEQSESYDGVTNLSTLEAHALALATFAAGHRVTASFTVPAAEGAELGDWQLGDDALVRISDWRFPPNPITGAPGFSGYLRIVGVGVEPGVEGAETYTFTMADFLEAL
jgi:hypothetical protein